MRSRLTLAVLLGFVILLVTGGIAQEEAQTGAIKVTIVSPPDGHLTLAAKVQVKGTVAVGRSGVTASMVILDMNGVAQKAELKADNTFSATAELAVGLNLISAIAIASNNDIGSAKVMVTRQRPVLFFDDFKEQPNPAWTAPVGTWVVNKNGRLRLPKHAGKSIFLLMYPLEYRGAITQSKLMFLTPTSTITMTSIMADREIRSLV